jgi:hypothetical protein
VNVLDAAHRTVHAYPGGSESLGPRIGIVPAVLRSKVNPNCHSHRLAIDEADLIMGATGDLSILQALAANHGCTLQRIDGSAPGSLFGAHLASTGASGDLAGVLAAALADGRVSANEAATISRAGAALQAAIVHLVSLAYADAVQSRAKPA